MIDICRIESAIKYCELQEQKAVKATFYIIQKLHWGSCGYWLQKFSEWADDKN